MIKEFGVRPGNKVMIYMPMTTESLIAIHACARIGATHVVVFGGFSAHELANRIGDCQPKMMIYANAGKEPSRVINYKKIVDEALKISGQTDMTKIIYQRDNLLKPEPLKPYEFDFHLVE
jgi:propionyl-CoA synthetase